MTRPFKRERRLRKGPLGKGASAALSGVSCRRVAPAWGCWSSPAVLQRLSLCSAASARFEQSKHSWDHRKGYHP